MTGNEFDQLEQALQQGGAASVLEQLADQLRREGRHHELFEALKMQVRLRLGLPLLYGDAGDDLEPAQRDQLEEGLIAACREVGLLLLDKGQIREGWMYLRPVGDRQLAAEQIARVSANEDNLDELVEVTLHEGVDPQRGYGLVLEHYGTCNAITMFESAVVRHPRAVQQATAGQLLRHVHAELLENVKADIARQEGQTPESSVLAELVADRDWMFSEYSYHIDTTHLASTVRFSRLLDDPELLRLAYDLTEYGRRLSAQFQYPDDEPFEEFYPAHARFFAALLGDEVESSLGYFREKARAVDPMQDSTAPIEVYIDLLARLQRYEEAIDTTIQMLPERRQMMGYAPSLLELCERWGRYDRLIEICRDRKDVLGFATGLLKRAGEEPASRA